MTPLGRLYAKRFNLAMTPLPRHCEEVPDEAINKNENIYKNIKSQGDSVELNTKSQNLQKDFQRFYANLQDSTSISYVIIRLYFNTRGKSERLYSAILGDKKHFRRDFH